MGDKSPKNREKKKKKAEKNLQVSKSPLPAMAKPKKPAGSDQ